MNSVFLKLTIFLAFSCLFGKKDPLQDAASIGIYALRMDTGEVLIDENSNKSLIPASTLKLVTTGAALHLLGPDFTFKTTLEYDGELSEEGVLEGNLYIKGDGDPCLGSDRVSPSLSWEKQLQVWAEAVEQVGIKKIQGKVIGDDSKWEKAKAPGSWSFEDTGNYYGAGACSLSFHENAYDLFFIPGKKEKEETTVLRLDPPLTSLHLENEVRTGPLGSGDRACIFGSEVSSVQIVRGTIPLGVSLFKIKGAIPNPAKECAGLLTVEIKKRGISVLEKDLLPSGKKTAFYVTQSPSLSAIVFAANQKSVNLYAESLLKKMGEALYQEGSTQAGTKAVEEFWGRQKVDLKSFYMADGSGLSRKNLITAKQLVSMLQCMKKSKAFTFFYDSLPLEGKKVHAKSGSMTFIRTYAGYVDNIAFALLINQCQDKEIGKKIDDFFAYLSKVTL